MAKYSDLPKNIGEGDYLMAFPGVWSALPGAFDRALTSDWPKTFVHIATLICMKPRFTFFFLEIFWKTNRLMATRPVLYIPMPHPARFK